MVSARDLLGAQADSCPRTCHQDSACHPCGDRFHCVIASKATSGVSVPSCVSTLPQMTLVGAQFVAQKVSVCRTKFLCRKLQHSSSSCPFSISGTATKIVWICRRVWKSPSVPRHVHTMTNAPIVMTARPLARCATTLDTLLLAKPCSCLDMLLACCVKMLALCVKPHTSTVSI